MQHRPMKMIPPWMEPGVLFTMIALPWFGVVGDLLSLYLLKITTYSLSRLCRDTIHSLPIALLLVTNHFYITTSLTVFLPTLLYSVSLMSLTVWHHYPCVHPCLQRKKPHIQREEVKIKRESHMLYIVKLQRDMHEMNFIVHWMVLSEILWTPPPWSRLTN